MAPQKPIVPKNKVDPRCKEREVKFSNAQKPKLDSGENLYEVISLMVMICCGAAILKEWKWTAWFALILSVMNISNYRPECELKQIFSSLVISLAALYMLYGNNPNPIADPFF